MKLFDFLNSSLLPRMEKAPDIFSHERYWGLTDTVSLYSHGFNAVANYKDQAKPIIQDLQDMTSEKYEILIKFKDYEVVGVNVFSSSDTKVHTHIHVEVSDEILKEMGLLK